MSRIHLSRSALFAGAFSVLLSAGAPAQAVICGDCNLDGRVAVTDALVAAQMAASLVPGPGTEIQADVCDLDGTGDVNILDALFMAQESAGIDTGMLCLPAPGGPPPPGTGSTALWQQATPPSAPSARSYHTMVYDSARAETVLFGGRTGSVFLDETWIWNGVSWNQAFPTQSPPGRYHHAMAYDSARGVTVLFGGVSATYLGDTWEWDGASWVEQVTPVAPSPRRDAGIAYDPVRGEIVLFGGALDFGSPPTSDTWVWDGATWTLEQPATRPSPRSMAALVFEPAAGRVFMYGGRSQAWGQRGDGWAWNGADWTYVPLSVVPGHQYDLHLTFDDGKAECISYGGHPGSGCWGDWEWDGNDFASLVIIGSAPPARLGADFVFDSSRGQHVLFGGVGQTGRLGDTWVLTVP